MTRISGSAKWFERGFVTYTNVAKKEMLGVSPDTLKKHGAVSEEVAIEMARGALAHSHADISVSVTGIAGPTGGVPGKPVGTVHFAWGVRGGPVQARRFRFKGDRVEVRMQSVYVAIQGLIDLLR
jgi:nicotinamide-nucleotide amidase